MRELVQAAFGADRPHVDVYDGDTPQAGFSVSWLLRVSRRSSSSCRCQLLHSALSTKSGNDVAGQDWNCIGQQTCRFLNVYCRLLNAYECDTPQGCSPFLGRAQLLIASLDIPHISILPVLLSFLACRLSSLENPRTPGDRSGKQVWKSRGRSC